MKLMKLTHYIYIGAAVATLASCGDFNERLNGYDADALRPTDVKNIVLELQSSDYEKIASLVKDTDIKTNKFFKSSGDAAKHIPVWLKSTYPTADNGSAAKITYKRLMQSVVRMVDAETITVTSPFELVENEWKYNPSVTLILPNEKGNATSKAFYGSVVAWVKQTYGESTGYLNKYGDTEYFSGCTSYNNRVEWIAADAKANTPGVYGSMSDEEVVKTMQDNLVISFGEVLKKDYADAEPVDGMEVVYTLDFTAHVKGDLFMPYTIKYMVTGKGEFTYVEGSLKPAE